MRPIGQRSLVTGIAVAAGSVALITVLIYPLREVVPVVSTSVLYLLPVLLVAGYWGLWLALPTAVASALAWNFFHIPPTGRFTIAEEENWVALVVFLVAAVVVSALADVSRSRAVEAERRRSEADLLAEMGRTLLGSASVEESLRAVGQRIARAFDLPSVTIELGWADSDQRRRALPLIVGGSRIGTVLVPAGTDRAVLDVLQDRVIPGLETLVAAVRRRDELESQVIETKALRRSNVMKTTLLRSVSHDLRSPLTAITTAADGLASDTLSEESRRELASVIRSESARLSRLVDNLLDLTRIQAGSVAPRQDWVGLDEVLRAAIDDRRGAAGGLRPADRPRPARAERRRRPARAGDRQRARERVPVRRGRARDHPGAEGRATARAANLRPRAGDPDAKSWSGYSSPSIGHASARAAAPAWGSPSRAASWRRTADASGPSRSPGRARAS